MKFPHYELSHTIVIDKELKNGNNGQSKHWSSSHKERTQWTRSLHSAHVETLNGTEFDFHAYHECVSPDSKIGIVITRVLGKGQRKWDADSVLRGNAKQLIDSLVEAGVARDDSPKYVEFALGLQDDSKRSSLESGYVRVEIHAQVS